jgi:putative DNA primase/helicase
VTEKEPRNWGSKFFHPDLGLAAVRAADAVLDLGPVRVGALDGRWWCYERGVWAPNDLEISRRVVQLLGERYRGHHSENVQDVLRTRVPLLEIEPVTAVVNVPNGLLHWRAPDGPYLAEHDPAALSTVQLPVEWDPSATCPGVDAFLAGAVDPDDLQRVWEMIGYLVMSGNPLQRMFLLNGPGGNGKGVLLGVIGALLGKANTVAVSLHSFATNRFAPARLAGRLANICGDIPSAYIEDTAKIKELAGQDRIDAEEKGRDPFSFEFWGKSIFSCNGLPGSADGSKGWTRRWEIVSFPNAPAAPDRGLRDRLCEPAELRGVLVKAIGALRALMDRGDFVRGEAAEVVHRDFAIRSNKLLAWIDEEMVMHPEGWTPRGDLLRAFRWWDANENPSGKAMSSQTFYDRIRQIEGLRESKRRGVRGVAGMVKRSEVHEVLPPDGDEEKVPPHVQGAIL